MNAKTPSYHGYRFPPEIISHAVWLYYRFCLSFRDVEDLLAKRGVLVSYETIRQWSRKFGAEYARKLKRREGRLHVTERYANNRAEVSHQPTRQRERQMRRFKSTARAQRFLSVHGVIQKMTQVLDIYPKGTVKLRR